MKRLMKWAVAAAGMAIAVVVLVVIYVGATVSVNAPWRSMLQQATILPAWLDPSPITADQVDRQLVTVEGYGVSLFASGVSDARVLRVTSRGDVLVSTPRDGRIVLLESDRDDGCFSTVSRDQTDWRLRVATFTSECRDEEARSEFGGGGGSPEGDWSGRRA